MEFIPTKKIKKLTVGYVSFDMPKDEYERMKEIADSHGLSNAEFARQAVRFAIDNIKPKES